MSLFDLVDEMEARSPELKEVHVFACSTATDLDSTKDGVNDEDDLLETFNNSGNTCPG